MKFNDIGTINPGVSEYLSSNKIVDMTEIQRQTYKHIMSGRDVCACSGTGTGKTAWACKIMSYYFRKIAFKSGLENEGLYIFLPTFLEDLRSFYDNPDPDFAEEIQMVKSCKLLIIDDIGAEKPSEWVRERLLSFINARVSNGLSTIYTSNLSLEELDNKMGQRVSSRIKGSTKEIQLSGSDRRDK